MAKTKSQRTLKVLDEIKQECDYLGDAVLGGEVDPDDAEIVLRVLRLMNDRDGRRATFLYHVVMEFNEGSITITPPPPTAIESFPPPGEGQKIIVEPSGGSRGEDTVAFDATGSGNGAAGERQPLALTRSLAHRRDGVYVEARHEDSSSVPEDPTETTQQRFERLREEIQRHRNGLRSRSNET